jgi:hypothetical protein
VWYGAAMEAELSTRGLTAVETCSCVTLYFSGRPCEVGNLRFCRRTFCHVRWIMPRVFSDAARWRTRASPSVRFPTPAALMIIAISREGAADASVTHRMPHAENSPSESCLSAVGALAAQRCPSGSGRMLHVLFGTSNGTGTSAVGEALLHADGRLGARRVALVRTTLTSRRQISTSFERGRHRPPIEPKYRAPQPTV